MTDETKQIAVLEKRLSELLPLVTELAQGQRKLMDLVHVQKLAQDANNQMFRNLIAKIRSLESRMAVTDQ